MSALNNLKILTKISVTFAVLILLSIAACTVNLRGLRQQDAAVDATEHTYQVLETLDVLTASMINQESGLRGYVITADENFLEPQKAGQASYQQAFSDVKALTADNPVQQQRLVVVAGLASDWTTKFLEPVLQSIRNEATRDDAQKMVATGQGKKIMDSIRAKVREMADEERGLLKARNAVSDAAAQSTQFSNYLTTTLTIGFSLLALWLVFSMVVRPIRNINDAMRSLANGDSASQIPHTDRKDEVGQMAAAVEVFRENAIERRRLQEETEANRSLSEQERLERDRQKAREAADVQFAVDNLATGLAKLSDGDVSYRIQQPFAASLDGVRDNFNASAEKLQSALEVVAQNAGGIGAGANEIRAAADDLARRTEQQAASVEETAAALEEITTTVKDSTKRAQEAGQLVSRAKIGAEQSGEVVRQAVVAMERIEKSSSEISNIIGVIDEIAFQTNLLALNAGVEAARAGEAGKGFAVVAQEVRELAQRSAHAAKEIKALITTSNAQVQQGVQLVDDTGKALETIVSEVQEINRHVAAIVEAAQEQSAGLQQINIAVNQMDQDTQKNAAMVEETTAASHSLAREVTSLNDLLGQFKLSNTGSRPAQKPRIAGETESIAPSPARALGRRLVSAFSGNAATKVEGSNWEEF